LGKINLNFLQLKTMNNTKSQQLFDDAKSVIPGGVNSPVRAFNGVGGTPVYFERGKGAYLYDADGNEYIDFVQSWGPMILGHANDKIIDAVKKTLDNGLGFGAPTEIETKLAKKIIEIMPAIDLVRLVSSGTEATMSAIRLARGYTNRDKIIKFEGCYHGHSDSLLVKSGSGALTMGEPNSGGVPKALAELTITLEYNNTEQLKTVMSEIGNEVACVIIEPIAGNMNLIPANVDFIKTLREECDKNGVVLIFDEVMSGFRARLGGASEYFGITPDLTTLGKVIGGGLPVGAFGGKREIMECIAPLGNVYQAGTLSGNPLSVSSGLAMLDEISKDANFYKELEEKALKLTDGIIEVAKNSGINMSANVVGSMFGLFFSGEKVDRFSQVQKSDPATFNKFFHKMLEAGVYLAPSMFEAGFISSAHTNADIDKVIEVANGVFADFDKE
jgi:glutamate-1-semialdehyde 2,1-aminomutase